MATATATAAAPPKNGKTYADFPFRDPAPYPNRTAAEQKATDEEWENYKYPRGGANQAAHKSPEPAHTGGTHQIYLSNQPRGGLVAGLLLDFGHSFGDIARMICSDPELEAGRHNPPLRSEEVKIIFVGSVLAHTRTFMSHSGIQKESTLHYVVTRKPAEAANAGGAAAPKSATGSGGAEAAVKK